MGVAAIGLSTAAFSTLVARILPDRKVRPDFVLVTVRVFTRGRFFILRSFLEQGAIANATSGTIGLIYCILAMGHADLALALCFGHASFRIAQILRSPNIITDAQNMKAGMSGRMPFPKIVPAWLYRIGWALRRIHSDFHLIHVLHLVSRRVHDQKEWKLNKWQQYAVIVLFLVLAGAPFTPLAHAKGRVFVLD